MLGFKMSLSGIILTLVLFLGGNGLNSADLAYGQFFETNSSDFTSNSTSSQTDDSNAADIVLLSQLLKLWNLIRGLPLIYPPRVKTSREWIITKFHYNGPILMEQKDMWKMPRSIKVIPLIPMTRSVLLNIVFCNENKAIIGLIDFGLQIAL